MLLLFNPGPTLTCAHSWARANTYCNHPMEQQDFSESLYSLLHLGGFYGDLNFYTRHCATASRVLELGCGDGRVAAALCLGRWPSGSLLKLESNGLHESIPNEQQMQTHTMLHEFDYVGIDMREAFLQKARAQLLGAPAQFLKADMLEPIPVDMAPFDAVILSANTLFCTPKHDALLTRCAQALSPSGRLLLDVYNAIPWHEDASGAPSSQSEDGTEDSRDMLVRVQDESGCEWTVYELEPEVDSSTQSITCRYEFEQIGGPTKRETLVHHYILPQQVRVDFNVSLGLIQHPPFPSWAKLILWLPSFLMNSLNCESRLFFHVFHYRKLLLALVVS